VREVTSSGTGLPAAWKLIGRRIGGSPRLSEIRGDPPQLAVSRRAAATQGRGTVNAAPDGESTAFIATRKCARADRIPGVVGESPAVLYPPRGVKVETIVLAGGNAGGLLIYLAILVVAAAGGWKVFTKAGHPGWAAIIPIYNIYILLKIAERPGWWLILYFIPIVGFVITIIVSIDIARNFGKGSGFGVGLAFLWFIFYPILGFGGAQYQGAAGGIGPGAAGGYCAHCGTALAPGDAFCGNCGASTATGM
jgi:hypothetical protein